MIFVTIVLVLKLLACIYLYRTWNFNYWKKLGVNGPKPHFLGNFPGLLMPKHHMVNNLDNIYRKYKKTDDFVGMYNFGQPQMLITSPALAHRVFTTYFKHFNANQASQLMRDSSDFIFGNHPFALAGKEWEEKRAELTPALTINRVKAMYPLTIKTCRKMTDFIKEQTKLTPKHGLDGKNLCLRFTSEVVTECVLGVHADSFGNRPTPILSLISTLFNTSFTFFSQIKFLWLFPFIRRFYKPRFVPKSTEEFFKYLMEDGIHFCKSQKTQKPQQCRIDFLDDMLQLQETKNISTFQLTSKTMIFIMKGFEFVASVLTHSLLMLGRHPAIQEKLRSEFERHVDKNGMIDFDVLVQLPLLNACIYETLRFFPPAFFSSKICTEPIELTNKNGKTLRVRKGEIVLLSLYSLMMDEDYYTNPKEFQPERFLKKNGGVKKYMDNGVFFGFGDGPRECMGKNFALAQSKAAIVEILRNFNIRVNPRTRKDNVWSPKKMQIQLEGGVWLDFEPRN